MSRSVLAAVAAAGDPADPDCAATLRALGLHDPVRAWKNLRRLARELPVDEATPFYDTLAEVLARTPLPDAALSALERLLGDAVDSGALVARLATDAAALERLLRVVTASEFLADTFSRTSELLGPALLDAAWQTPVTVPEVRGAWELLRSRIASDTDVPAALRRFKRQTLARIGVQDVLDILPVDDTLATMTALAETCLEAAYVVARDGVTARFGIPHDPLIGGAAQFCVLAMGKCGGAELNYSSDIDLVFLYSGSGETDAVAGGKSVSNTEYFAKLGERMIALLTSHEGGGAVFRIDMRLRPMGTKGTLVTSYDAMMEYYETWGQTWERQMLIKARPVAGDLALGEALLQELRPFVYPKFLDLQAIREVHELKRAIEQRTRSEGDGHVDVKTGPGGIRDVEFAVQFLQLLHGGRRPEVRAGNTLDAITALRDSDILTRQDAEELADAYRFLRRVENRLQLWADLQRHRLPTKSASRDAFAAGLGYASDRSVSPWEAFERAYDRSTAIVRRIFNQVLGETFDEAPVQAPVRALLRSPHPDADAVARALAPYAIRDPDAAWVHLEHLAFGPRQAPLTAAARDAFAELCPRLLQHVAGTPDPDHTLGNVRTFLDTFGNPGTFYELLLTNPKAIELFVALASFSETLVRILIADPGMLDFLISNTQLQHAARPKHIKRALDRFLEINPDFHTAVRRFRNGELLRIGLRDMLDLAPIAEVTAELTAVADTVIDHLWAHEAAELTREYGSPLEAGSGALAESVVLALGKCGGRDLNYTSDLDVVFVYSGPGETAGELRAPISNREYFQKLAQRVTRRSTESSKYGALYKLDARLRPYGGQGELAMTAEQYLDYYRTRAAPWEMLALTRLRPMAGSRVLGAYLVADIHDYIFAAGFWNADLVEYVDTMLRKVQSHRADPAAGLGLKNEVGGLVEVEFLVQLLMLRFGAAHPAVRHPNTLHVLGVLEAEQLIPAEDARKLADAYVFLRRTENRLRIMYGGESAALPTDSRARDRLAVRLGVENRSDLPDGEVLAETVHATCHTVHAIYSRTLEHLTVTGT